MYNLLHHSKKYQWTEACQKSFQKLKHQLTNAPILGAADPTKGTFIISCDASLNSVGAVLSQIQDGEEITLHYWSKKLNPAQRNYCATERELYSLVESVQTFHHYVAGAPFIIRTDHASLQWLQTFKHPEGKLASWMQKLAPYKFQIFYRRGVAMGHADALSRRPQRPCDPSCKKCTRFELKEEKSVNWTAVQPQDDWDEKNHEERTNIR